VVCVQNSVLEKLKKELSSLKADSLNPAIIRTRQATNIGTTESLLVDQDPMDIARDGRRAGGSRNGRLRQISLRVTRILSFLLQKDHFRFCRVPPHPSSPRRRYAGSTIDKGRLRVPPSRTGPKANVVNAHMLHSATTPRLCEDQPIRLYPG
jgi:hypothetical protein